MWSIKAFCSKLENHSSLIADVFPTNYFQLNQFYNQKLVNIEQVLVPLMIVTRRR